MQVQGKPQARKELAPAEQHGCLKPKVKTPQNTRIGAFPVAIINFG